MWCWWRWPTRRLGWSGPCSAEAKPSGPKPDPPPNAERKKHYCEGDDDVMAKQGNRDRLNPRHCPSLELDSLTGRRSSDSIRASGNDCAAPKGRIDDCKPNPLLITKTLAIRGASIDDNAPPTSPKPSTASFRRSGGSPEATGWHIPSGPHRLHRCLTRRRTAMPRA